MIKTTGRAMRYVGFWPRALAQVVDNALASILLLPVAWLSGPGVFLPGHQQTLQEFLLGLVMPMVAFFLMWRYFQTSPGKRWIGAKIVDEKTGGKPTDRQLLLRVLGYVPSIGALGLGVFAVFSDPRCQAWHDKWASTVVIYDR